VLLTIPLSIGSKLYPEVRPSLASQGIPFEVYDTPSDRPLIILDKTNRTDWLDNICYSRNKCLIKMRQNIKRAHDVFCMLDSDCAFDERFTDSAILAETVLINDPTYSVIALSPFTGIAGTHIPHCGCWFIHQRFFDLGIAFTHDGEVCDCKTTCQKIRAAGSDIKYLDGIKRIRHLSKEE
jgi:hypothetical protein